jgi:hypothetical protein
MIWMKGEVVLWSAVVDDWSAASSKRLTEDIRRTQQNISRSLSLVGRVTTSTQENEYGIMFYVG